MATVFARQQHTAGRGADRRAGVVLREAHPAGCQGVNVRGLDLGLAVGSQLSISEIVGQDVNDIGRLFCCLTSRTVKCGQQAQQNQDNQSELPMTLILL